ncbi:helix-turn-helix domain-containing protein, partial [Chloroflexota bacterium]
METRKFGARLRELREQAGLSQSQLAEKVGVNFTYLSKIESGAKSAPSEKVILKLAKALNTDKDELMTLAGRVPSDIAEVLKSPQTLQLLRSGCNEGEVMAATEKGRFNIRLRELRKQAGLSQRQLAKRIGVNFSYLSKIESGALPPPSKKVILTLAEALNANKDELMTLAGRIPSDIAQILKNQETLKLLRSGRIQKKKAFVKKEGVNIMKHLVNYKGLARVATAVVLVCAVAASLWFAAPTPVKAITVSVSNPSTARIGESYSFTVTVNIQSSDVLPVKSIDLEIYNESAPSTYKATCTGLPLAAGGTTYLDSQTGGGNVNVSASPGARWGYATGESRSGYGYAYGVGWGTYPSLGTDLGYGYGYGSVYTGGTTSITYSVSWTPPTSWPTGTTYEIRTLVNGSSSVAFTTSTTPSFTLYQAADDDGGVIYYVGGAGVVVEDGVTDVSQVVSRTSGAFTQTVTAESTDGNVELAIDKGTVGKVGDIAISEITIAETADPPEPPAGTDIVLAYDLGPDGATFVPAITLTFDLPADFDATTTDVVIAMWDGDEWILLGGTVNTETNTIEVAVDHFTPFSVISQPVPEE